MTAVAPMLEITDAILEIGGETIQICMQCGTCSGVCPWNLVRKFSPRLLIRQASLGVEGYESEALWNCVTCRTCVENCPRGVDIIDVIRSARSLMQESGTVPPPFRAPLGSLKSDGNPWQTPREERSAWNQEIGIPEFGEECENLFYACCTHCYDGRNKKVLKDMAELLKKGGVSMGIIGNEESCCADQAHKCGAYSLALELVGANDQLFAEKGVRKIIASSPHCMNMFNKEYQGDYQALHYTQVFDRLIAEGKLKPSKELALKVAYHDPCYLGRHNGIYEEPRRVLLSIPGLEYIELPRSRENSLCCGGGGGGIWSEVPVAERFGSLRVQEALEAGAEVIATACPFCTIMLEDAQKALGKEEEIRVMDVAELLFESVE
jgi:Fe-S oxidoreductase